MEWNRAYVPTNGSFRSSHGTRAGEFDARLGDAAPSIIELGLPRRREAWESACGDPPPLSDGAAVWAEAKGGLDCLPAEAPLTVGGSGWSKRDLGCSCRRGKACGDKSHSHPDQRVNARAEGFGLLRRWLPSLRE